MAVDRYDCPRFLAVRAPPVLDSRVMYLNARQSLAAGLTSFTHSLTHSLMAFASSFA
jgi:hypothetical protein